MLATILLTSCGGNFTESFSPQSNEHLPYGIPGQAGHIVIREGYAAGFSCHHKIAVWVSYRLTKEKILAKTAVRANRFREDREFSCCSAKPTDYKGSGFDRGHLAPAADMAFSVRAMEESFLMSNIAPQIPGFNRGIWRQLEIKVRQWALAENDVIVVTGAVFPQEVVKMIGPGKITVPEAFFKIIYDLTPPQKMIAFVIPNENGRKNLPDYVLTVDAVEELTGLDFFSDLPRAVQQKLEAESDLTQW